MTQARWARERFEILSFLSPTFSLPCIFPSRDLRDRLVFACILRDNQSVRGPSITSLNPSSRSCCRSLSLWYIHS